MASQIPTSVTILNSLRGFQAISLTEYKTSAQTAIAEGSMCEIAGAYFDFPTDLTPSPTTWTAIASGSTAYIVLIPAGTAGSQVVTAEYVADEPVWRTDLQGWYASAGSVSRAIASVYKVSGTSYVDKHILNSQAVTDFLGGREVIESKIITTTGTVFTPGTDAPGYTNFRVTLIGSGGGGAAGGSVLYGAGAVMAASGGGSGVPGAIVRKTLKLKGAVVVTIGAGGLKGAAPAAGANDGNNGSAGGITKFGDHLVVPGGLGGIKGLKGVANTIVIGGSSGTVFTTPSLGATIIGNLQGGAGQNSVATGGSGIAGSGAGGTAGGTTGSILARQTAVEVQIYSDLSHGYGGAGSTYDIGGANGEAGETSTAFGGAGGGGGGAYTRPSGNYAGGAGGDGGPGACIIEWGTAIESAEAYA